MPIRFQCPNGHPLEVPDEFAGRRGACQDCGAKLVVPGKAAEPPAEKPLPAGRPATERAASAPTERTPSATAAPARPVAKPVAKPVARATPTAPPPPPGNWRLRTATGDQFGPATEEQFRQWITDYRVTADSYVWREGWADWRLASEAASELPAPLAPPPPAPSAPPLQEPRTSSAPSRPPESAADRYAARRRRAAKNKQTAAALLLVLTLGLGGVFTWVMFFRGSAGVSNDWPPESEQPLDEDDPFEAMPGEDAAEGDEPFDDAPFDGAPADDEPGDDEPFGEAGLPDDSV